MKLSIIIPAHNEEKRIGNTLKAYSSYFDKKVSASFSYEIVVVINNTKDNTEAVVRKAKQQNARIRYISYKRGGKGFAVIEGFKDALKRSNDLIGFVDADMATPPEAFDMLISAMHGAEGAIASRWLKESVILKKQTPIGRLKSGVFNFIVRSLFLLPYSDTQCGAKLFSRKSASTIVREVGITRWAFDIEVLYVLKKKKLFVREVPTIWEDKEYTKIRLVNASLEMFLAVVRLRLLHSPFTVIVSAYDSLPKELKIHHKLWK